MRRATGPAIVTVILVVGVLSFTIYKHYAAQCAMQVPSKKCYKVMWAVTPAQRVQGLSGASSLAKDSTMVFSFSRPGSYCFWMKDMHFKLDILWLSQSNTVVHIVKGASPGSYPHMFCPKSVALRVVEMNAGQATQDKIHVGSKITFHTAHAIMSI